MRKLVAASMVRGGFFSVVGRISTTAMFVSMVMMMVVSATATTSLLFLLGIRMNHHFRCISYLHYFKIQYRLSWLFSEDLIECVSSFIILDTYHFTIRPISSSFRRILSRRWSTWSTTFSATISISSDLTYTMAMPTTS